MYELSFITNGSPLSPMRDVRYMLILSQEKVYLRKVLLKWLNEPKRTTEGLTNKRVKSYKNLGTLKIHLFPQVISIWRILRFFTRLLSWFWLFNFIKVRYTKGQESLSMASHHCLLSKFSFLSDATERLTDNNKLSYGNSILQNHHLKAFIQLTISLSPRH